MKKLIILLSVLNFFAAYNQEVINFYDDFDIDFTDTSQYKYLSIDTNNVWTIAKPKNKQNLTWISDALFTDTSLYYGKNIKSSFQVKLYFNGQHDYYVVYLIHKYDFEKNRDGGIIETSYDGGHTWQNILVDPKIGGDSRTFNLYNVSDTIASFENQPGFTGSISDLTETVFYFFTGNVEEDTMLLKFTITSDSFESENEGWMFRELRFYTTLLDGIEESNTSTIGIYPNPVNEDLRINGNSENISKIEIFSTTGRLLTGKTGNYISSIDVSGLSKGIYLLVLRNENNYTWFSKFCKI